MGIVTEVGGGMLLAGGGAEGVGAREVERESDGVVAREAERDT